MVPVIYTLKTRNSPALAGSRVGILLPCRKTDKGFHTYTHIQRERETETETETETERGRERERSMGVASIRLVNPLMGKVS